MPRRRCESRRRKRRRARIGGQSAPRFLKAREFGMPVHQQYGELMRGKRMQRCARRGWPPCEATFREALGAQPEAVPIVDQQLEGGASAVAKEKERAGERIVVEAVAAQRGEPVDALTEVDGFVGEQDGELRRQLDHDVFRSAAK